MLENQFTIKIAYDIAAITFSFLIRLWFLKSKSILGILHRRYSQGTLKRIQNLENPDYRQCKAEADLKFLLRHRDISVIPNVFNVCLSSQSLKTSLTYEQCQLKLSQEEICHTRAGIRVLKNNLPLAVPHCNGKSALFVLIIVNLLFLKDGNRILASKQNIQ